MNKYYTEYTDAMRRFQHSEKYKTYRRKYEAKYRDDNRIMVNYLSWKVMCRKYDKRITPQKEINYLLKRFMNEN